MGQSKPERMVDQDPSIKASLRAQYDSGFDQIIGRFQQVFSLTTPPYTATMNDGSQRFLKDYRLWDKTDLMRVDPNHVLRYLDHMAELDDYAHLGQILPNSYRGDVKRFSKDIMAAYNSQIARGAVKMGSVETDKPASAGEVQKSAFTLQELKEQAGILPKIALQDATDILPATRNSSASIVKAA